MSNTIVWATDGSEHAERALSVAKTLMRDDRAAIIVLHVVQRFATRTGLAVHADEELVEDRLERAVEELSSEGVHATLRIVNHVGPQPAHEIADVAREAGADLIVVGSRGHGPLAGLLLGSVATRLLHIAPCAVVVVPAAAASPATS